METKQIDIVDVVQKGNYRTSKSRQKDSRTSVSSLSSTHIGQEVVDGDPSTTADDVLDFDSTKNFSVSQPVTLERARKAQSDKNRSKHVSAHVGGGGSLPRSPFFGSRKNEKGCLSNTVDIFLLNCRDCINAN